MREDIFDYLRDYGFDKEDIYAFQKENDKLYFVDIVLVTTNIKFFEDKGLSCEEVINIIKDNPYLLTIGTKKKEMLDNIYNSMFDRETLRNLIINYPDSYIVNPLELEELITYLKNKGINVKEAIMKDNSLITKNIKDIIIN